MVPEGDQAYIVITRGEVGVQKEIYIYKDVAPKYVLTFIYSRRTLCFIFVYNCGLTVRNKRICYVMLCYIFRVNCSSFKNIGPHSTASFKHNSLNQFTAKCKDDNRVIALKYQNSSTLVGLRRERKTHPRPAKA